MLNRMKSLFLIFALFTIASLSYSAPNAPVPLLQYIADNMIAGLKANQATLKSKPQIVFSLAHKYVVPNADLNEMAKRVLPPQVWLKATDAQQKKFQQEFTTLLIRTYASALSSYKDETIQFYPPRGQVGNTVEVNSQIKSNDHEPIKVTYRLLQKNGAWKLYDMSVEGVSLISSFRSQFANILAQGNMDTLLVKLAGHNNMKR